MNGLQTYVPNANAGIELVKLSGEMKLFEAFVCNSLAVANDIISCRSRQKQLTAQVDNLLARRAAAP